ncbi:MAG: hypothetical protein ACTHM7_06515 [Ginsengibacter sp.]
MLEFDAQTNWWDDSPEAAKDFINRGLDDVDEGKVAHHKKVMKKYDKQ